MDVYEVTLAQIVLKQSSKDDIVQYQIKNTNEELRKLKFKS
jgi:hypothetical protein